MTDFNAALLLDPERYNYDPLTRRATEEANRRIDARWWLAWMRNLKANDAAIRALPPVSRRFGEWAGEPCLVCGAGPSLQSNMEHVIEAARRGWRIVAADRAFEPLARAGVRPNFTLASDASPAVAAFFDPDLLRETDAFALCVIAHPDTFARLERCRRFPFACINPFSAFWTFVQKNYPEDLPCLRPGFVVTFSAVDLAQWMGCREVVTIGNELCWPSREAVEPRYRDARILDLPGGRATIPAFHRAARAFRFFPDFHPETRFADASGGLAEGWTPVQLDRLLRDPHYTK